MMKLSEITKVSWQPEFSPRLFGYLQGWYDDGNARVRRGARVHHVPRGLLTYEQA
jgi:hypothetical protein